MRHGHVGVHEARDASTDHARALHRRVPLALGSAARLAQDRRHLHRLHSLLLRRAVSSGQRLRGRGQHALSGAQARDEHDEHSPAMPELLHHDQHQHDDYDQH